MVHYFTLAISYFFYLIDLRYHFIETHVNRSVSFSQWPYTIHHIDVRIIYPPPIDGYVGFSFFPAAMVQGICFVLFLSEYIILLLALFYSRKPDLNV